MGRGLSRDEFDEVMRRATELAADELEGDRPEVSEDEVYRIASEVGLDPAHVRKAIGELRRGSPTSAALDASDGGMLDRLYGPALVRAARVVPGTPKELSDQLDEYLVGGRLLQRVRRGPLVMQYRPAVDWMSQIARAASGTARRYYLAAAKSVEVRLEAVDETHTRVEFLVDSGIQGDYAAGGIIGSIFGGLAAGGAAFGASVAVFPEIAAVGLAAGAAGGTVAGVTKLTRSFYRKKWGEVLAEVEGVLDALDLGERLQPPPSSWRKWVERQFHGARRLVEDYGGAKYDDDDDTR